jgi:hypothetical protein
MDRGLEHLREGIGLAGSGVARQRVDANATGRRGYDRQPVRGDLARARYERR